MTLLPQFLEQFKATSLGILIDDTGTPTPRSALIAPAYEISPSVVNRAITLSAGLTFVSLSPERASAFMLQSMARPALPSPLPALQNQGGLALYTSVEARHGISTGISAADRAATLRVLGGKDPQPRDLVKPGHIFPVEAREGGVLVKSAIAEGALDLVTMSGYTDAALFMDLLDARGDLLPLSEVPALAYREQLPIITLTDLIEYRLNKEPLITRAAEALLPTTQAGELRAIVYRSRIHDVEHIALVKGDVTQACPVLVRVQVESTVTDVFGGGDSAGAPSSRTLLHRSLSAINERGCGVLLYLRRPFLNDKSGQVQTLSNSGSDPRSANMMREYGVGAQILRDLGISKIEVLSSSSRLLAGLTSFGITVVSQRPVPEIDSDKR